MGSTLARVVFESPNGTQTELIDQNTGGAPYSIPNACNQTPTSVNANRGTVFKSTDGSSLVFIADSQILDQTAPGFGEADVQINGILRFPNGVTYRVDNSAISWIRDRNGNKIQFQYTSGAIFPVTFYLFVGVPSSIVDSLGRTISINYNDSSCNGCTTITYPGASGVSRVIQVAQAHLSNHLLRADFSSVQTFNQLFPGTYQGNSNFDPVLPSSIKFPDGREFTFSYNIYGELARVNLPTGGAMEYDFGDGNNSSTSGFQGNANDNNPVMIYRRLQERREYAAGGTTITSRTHYTVSSSGGNTVDTDLTVDPSSGNPISKVIHTMSGSPLDTLTLSGTGCNNWNEGLETQTASGANGALVTVQHIYGTQTGCMNDPHVHTETTTLNDTNQVSQVIYTFDSFNNLTDKKEYDWNNGSPGGLLRESTAQYLTASAYTSTDVWLVKLPTLTTIGNGATAASETQFTYDQTAVSDESGVVGHDTAYGTSFTTRGNATTVGTCLNAPSCSWLNSVSTYDIAGNATSVQDPRGNTTQISYADAQNTFAFPTTVTNALAQSVALSYDYSASKLLSTTDANGVVATYQYSDPLDRLTAQTISQPSHQGVPAFSTTTSYCYPTPNLSISYRDQGIMGMANQYDGLGRASESDTFETAIACGAGTVGSYGHIATTTSYDAAGRVYQVTNPSRPGDNLSFPTTYAYDTVGRLSGVMTPDGANVATHYSGNQMQVTDQVGNKRWMSKDGLGRLSQVIEDPGTKNYVTNYGYDSLGNLVLVSQGQTCPGTPPTGGQKPAAGCRYFGFDSLSRLTSTAQAESGTTSYVYDSAGNVVGRQDNAGQQTCYSYDALNRVTAKIYYQGAANTNCGTIAAGSYLASTAPVFYSYDQGAINGVGQLTQSARQGGSVTAYTAFDALGDVLRSQQTTAGNTYNFSYQYNTAGALTAETYPAGGTVTTAYDAANRAIVVAGGLSGQQKNYVAQLSYAPQGSPLGFQYGNAVTRSAQYDNRLRPSMLADSLNGSSSSYLFQENPISWYANSNVSAITLYEGGPGAVGSLTKFAQSFTYTALNQLAQMKDSGGGANQRNFNYDQYGNLWMANTSGSFPQSVITPSTNVYNGFNQSSADTYDAAGNTTGIVSICPNCIGYDAENLEVSFSATGTSYAYDGNGQRVLKAGGGVSTVYVYDAAGALAAEYSSATAGSSPCTTCYVSVDHLGSVRMVTDQSGTVVARHDYLAFGEEIGAGYAGRTNAGLWGASDNADQRFTGQVRDVETGLDYFNARYYESPIGRFMSPDPGNAGTDATNPQTWNAYVYGVNSPLSEVDPSGLDPVTPPIFKGTGICGPACLNNTLNINPGCVAFGTEGCITAPQPVTIGGSGPGGNSGVSGASGSGVAQFSTTVALLDGSSPVSNSVSSVPPNSGTARGLATCAASKASSFANLLGLPKDNFWAQAFLGNDFSTAANLLLASDQGTNGPAALLSNPTPINATSIALSAIGKKVVGTGGLVVKETPGGAPYAVTKFLPIAETVGGKVLFKGIAAFSAAKLVYDGAAFGYAELQCAGVVQ